MLPPCMTSQLIVTTNKSLILVRNITSENKMPTSIFLTSINLTFDPTFNLQFLKGDLVKLKRNLVSVPWKRNYFEEIDCLDCKTVKNICTWIYI